MPEVHAILSASSSKRWLNCTPSARLEQNFPNESSVYAEEGTAAHALGEYKLRKYLHERVRRPTSEFDNEEMDANTDIYAEFIIARQKNGGTKNLQESRFVEDFIQYAAALPEPNRRVLDMMYEAAWHVICIYRFGMTRDQVPEPWYDTVSEVRKNGKEHADGKC